MLKTIVLPRQGRLGTQNTGKVEKRERRFLQTDLHRTLTGQTSVINSEEGIETLERYGKESFSTAHSLWPPCKDDQFTKTGSGQTHRENALNGPFLQGTRRVFHLQQADRLLPGDELCRGAPPLQSQVRKRISLRNFTLNMIVSPSEARDKHT